MEKEILLIVIGALIGTVVTLVSSLAYEWFFRPKLEIRKDKIVRELEQKREITSMINEIISRLTIVVDFDGFTSTGRIIPTRANVLIRQLERISEKTDLLQDKVSRLSPSPGLELSVITSMTDSFSKLSGASERTADNLRNKKFADFKKPNQKVLKNYLEQIKPFSTRGIE